MRVHVCGTRRTGPVGAEEGSRQSISQLPRPFVVHPLVSQLPSHEGDFTLLLDVQNQVIRRDKMATPAVYRGKDQSFSSGLQRGTVAKAVR
jgi:hypothetical protein